MTTQAEQETGPKPGDLKVWYIPQVPMPHFSVPAESLREAVKLLDAITSFSAFEFENRVKPDYSDAGGISRWESDGEGGYDWYDVDEFELRDAGFDV